MTKWYATKYPGIRFREHHTRKHGINKDKYFTIRYQLEGKRREEGLGWASQHWTLQKANARLSEIKENQRTGQGPQSLKEKRRLEKSRREKVQAEEVQKKKEGISFKAFFHDVYCPAQTGKSVESFKAELSYFKVWIRPVFKDIPFKKIAPFHCEKIKKNMLEAGRAPSSLNYCFGTIRQVWNMARRDGIINSESPTKGVKIPKINNKRLRFLSHNEADILLEELKKRSMQVHDMALLSLHCGLRAGEIFSFEWADIDFEHRLFILKNTKSGRTRAAYMTDRIESMLAGRKPFANNKFVFPDRDGKKIKRISNCFARAVDAVKLNNGITDKRQKVVFHTWRHTFASWHVQAGTDLYTLQVLLGHQSFAMVQRYAHLSEETLQEAVKNLEESMLAKNDVIELRKKAD